MIWKVVNQSIENSKNMVKAYMTLQYCSDAGEIMSQRIISSVSNDNQNAYANLLKDLKAAADAAKADMIAEANSKNTLQNLVNEVDTYVKA